MSARSGQVDGWPSAVCCVIQPYCHPVGQPMIAIRNQPAAIPVCHMPSNGCRNHPVRWVITSKRAYPWLAPNTVCADAASRRAAVPLACLSSTLACPGSSVHSCARIAPLIAVYHAWMKGRASHAPVRHGCPSGAFSWLCHNSANGTRCDRSGGTHNSTGPTPDSGAAPAIPGQPNRHTHRATRTPTDGIIPPKALSITNACSTRNACVAAQPSASSVYRRRAHVYPTRSISHDQ
jgi:hypothetical protein